MNELKIQHEYVMDFFCRLEDQGGLGYRNVSNIVVSNDLFIPSIIGEFVRNSQPETWDRLLKKFNHDEHALQTALKDKIKETLLDAQNVATYINTHKSITFEGEKVWLFYVSGTELNGDEDFKHNIFCAVEESSHNLNAGDKKLYTIRPDIMFFVNGIYFGYMELKSSTKGQTAHSNGRQKVAKDYLATLKALVELEKRDPKVMRQRKELMAIYENAIHLTASDCNETYVMRGINQFFDTAHQGFACDPAKTVEELISSVLEPFKPYPISILAQTEKGRFEEVMRALYSKKMVEKEILYYNFIEYKYVKKEGAKERTSNTGRLIAPRPKQKFGCDKIMGRITEMLDHEKEPGYYINKLREYLQNQGIASQKIDEIILLRERYFNNKFVYSLLLQYAAGFGKSNIIGWTALQLKDYRYEGKYAYDKVMIVVDRLQLRDQLDTTMMNMNIDKSMFVEATDRNTFINALDSKTRIIVVNIQKFLDLQDAISAAGKKLKKMRVAFLIDEIHRSNSGENNQEMIDLFARLQESFYVGGQTVVKKNLLIGFTATPSEETLAKFGEFRSALTKPMWIPFDFYTMREAINDGYILDPTKTIIPYTVPVDFQLPEELHDSVEDDINIVLHKDDVYSFEPRMRKIAEFIVHRLVSLVYKKIRGEGKAMLAVRSIPNAIKYFNIIRSEYAKKCQESAYKKYKDAPIAIIYSDDQKNESCATLNGGASEDRVIQNFRQAKNGLIIVVDKLQTGFDEPKLHTLFLDKEISDINAIQTISRVNRKYNKHKEDCHIVDCSWHNVNVENIRQAFKKFCDMAISDFNPEFEARSVAKTYKLLHACIPYLQWFSRYQHEREDTHFVLEMEDGIRKWIEQCFYQEALSSRYNVDNGLTPADVDYHPVTNLARDLRSLIGHYFSSIRMLEGVFVIDSKYYDEVFLKFWQIYCNIYREITKQTAEVPYEYEIIDSNEEPGITLVDGEGGGNGEHGGHRPLGGSGTQSPKGKSMDEVLAILQRLHETEQLTAEQAQIWLREIGLMFEYIKEDSQFCAFAKDDNYSEDEKLAEYKKVQGKYRRSLKNRPDFVQVERFKQMIVENVEQLFAIFMADLLNVENGDSDFDYDTTINEHPQGGLSMEDLIEMARRKIRPEYNELKLRQRIIETYADHFRELAQYMRSFNETTRKLFLVLNTPSLSTLDGMDSVVKESLNMVCMAEGLSLSDKRMHLDMLLMRYEVYLKKLYYIIHNKEIPTMEEGKGATLSNAVFAFPALRGLKNNPLPAYQEFSQKLSFLRQLRNDESHGSMNMTEQEVDTAINIVIDMYLFVTGMNIAKLEAVGEYDDINHQEPLVIPIHSYNKDENSRDYSMAAEPFIPADELREDQRIDILRNSLVQMFNHGGYRDSDRTFSKQRHWISVYRIAADEGFIIEGDFKYFKQIVDRMNLSDCKVALNIATIERNIKGVYRISFANWSDKGLSGKDLYEYNDIKHCAEVFLNILSRNRPKK